MYQAKYKRDDDDDEANALCNKSLNNANSSML